MLIVEEKRTKSADEDKDSIIEKVHDQTFADDRSSNFRFVEDYNLEASTAAPKLSERYKTEQNASSALTNCFQDQLMTNMYIAKETEINANKANKDSILL